MSVSFLPGIISVPSCSPGSSVRGRVVWANSTTSAVSCERATPGTPTAWLGAGGVELLRLSDLGANSCTCVHVSSSDAQTRPRRRPPRTLLVLLRYAAGRARPSWRRPTWARFRRPHGGHIPSVVTVDRSSGRTTHLPPPVATRPHHAHRCTTRVQLGSSAANLSSSSRDGIVTHRFPVGFWKKAYVYDADRSVTAQV